jgi:hypothetical protein
MRPRLDAWQLERGDVFSGGLLQRRLNSRLVELT